MTKSIRIKGEAKGYNLIKAVDRAVENARRKSADGATWVKASTDRTDALAAYIGQIAAKHQAHAITSTELCELTLDALVHESNGAIEVNW